MAGAAPRALGRTGDRLKRLRRLGRERREREQTATYVVEGPHLVEEVLRPGSPAEVEALYAERDRYPALVRAALEQEIGVWEADEGVLDSALTTRNPQPVVAVVARPSTASADLGALAASGPVVVADQIADPGNAGTVLRTVGAAGGSLVLCGDAVDPYSPKVVRAAAGAASRVPVAVVEDLARALGALDDAGIRTVAAVAHGGLPPEAVDLRPPVALVVGGEASGLAPDVAERVAQLVTIPMAGEVESLNVAVAASTLVLESARQQRQAAEVDSTLDLVSRVSHELRSPLTAVKGFTGALVARWDKLDDAQKRSMLGDVAREADHVSRLVTELLEVSRIDGYRLRLERRYLDPGDVVREALERTAVALPDDAVDLDLADDLPEIAVDPHRIVPVIANLVENAIKYGDAGSVRVSVGADGDDVVIEVVDHGEGLDAAQLATAFDRRAQHGGRPSGIGLGLWLGRALVEAHGGSLELRSWPGEGVQARLVLPVASRSTRSASERST